MKESWDFGSLKKINSKALTSLLILIPIVLALMIRIQPLYLSSTDSWAQTAVYNQMNSQITEQIHQQFPNLAGDQLKNAVQEQFQQDLVTHNGEITSAISTISKRFKDRFKDDNGALYAEAIDPYAYLRRAQNVLDTGRAYDELRNGVPWNNHMIAPIGIKMGFNLHPYIIAYWHKFLGLFGVTDLFASSFYLPILFSCLAVIPAFLLGKRFAGNVGGFVAGTIIASAPSAVARTIGGFVDTDAYNIFFPLLIAWLFFESLEQKKMTVKMVYASFAAFSVAIYSLLWKWWYIFDLTLIVLIGFLAFHLFKLFTSRKGVKEHYDIFINSTISSVAYLFITGFFVSIFIGAREFFSLFSRPVSYYFLKAPHISLFPNVMTTVAEQNSSSISGVISMMGGPILFFLALTGSFLVIYNLNKMTKRDILSLLVGIMWYATLVFLIQPANIFIYFLLLIVPVGLKISENVLRKHSENFEFSIFLATWFVITFFAAIRGLRFGLLFTAPFALALGVFFGRLYPFLQDKLTKVLSVNRKLITISLILIVLFSLYPIVSSGYSTAKSYAPSMNDAWYSSLSKIKAESKPNAIINSWWDFGHWFKMVGNRAVTFDGASQNTPMAYWIGKALSTHNEQQSAGILRMLDCGSNNAFEVLNKEVNDTPKTISLIGHIVMLSKQDAQAYLQNKGITNATITKVLPLTHCNPPEDYFITSSDMVGKAGVWSHFGNWDFDKAREYEQVHGTNEQSGVSILMADYNMTEEAAKIKYYDIQASTADDWSSNWYTYIDSSSCIWINKAQIGCVLHAGKNNTLPFTVDFTSLGAYIKTDKGKKIFPESLVMYRNSTGYAQIHYPKSPMGDISFGLVDYGLDDSGQDQYGAILMSSKIALSIFTKLYFYDGAGLKCFDKFSHATQVTGAKIDVWRVNWGCLPK